MSTPVESQPDHERRWIYLTSLGLLVLFVVVGLIVFGSAKSTSQANAKADQLIAALHQAGARTTPDKDQIVRVLGSDGGATCHHPAEALSKATLFSMLTNGASGPGLRPIVADSRLVKGQLLIIQIYCPGQLNAFKTIVDDLKTADVVKE